MRLMLPISFILAGIFLFISLEGCNLKDLSAAEIMESGNGEQAPRIALDVGIIVSDMDASLNFYKDLLQLPVVAQVRTSLIGAGTMIQLRHGASLIKLVEMDDPPSSKTKPGITTTYGHRYITLMVEDISIYASALEKANVPFSMPLTELGNGAKIMMVEDPDGNTVEFVQEKK